MVLEAKELLLGVNIDGEGVGLVVDVGLNNNIAQLYNGEGGEEVLVIKVEHVDTKLVMCQVDYDSKVEGDDKK
jgi:hypothetical protein